MHVHGPLLCIEPPRLARSAASWPIAAQPAVLGVCSARGAPPAGPYFAYTIVQNKDTLHVIYELVVVYIKNNYYSVLFTALYAHFRRPC